MPPFIRREHKAFKMIFKDEPQKITIEALALNKLLLGRLFSLLSI